MKLTRSVGTLAGEYPFFAGLLRLDRFMPDPNMPTMAVCVPDGLVQYRYSETFVEGCSLGELAGVIHHEINHVLFRHMFADPENCPDRIARMIAEEVTVNEWVREPLPGQPVTLEQFPQLPPDEDTDTRYKRLEGQCEKYKGLRPIDRHDLWADPDWGAKLRPIEAAMLANLALGRSSPRLLLQSLLARNSGGRDLALNPRGSQRRIDWKRQLRIAGLAPHRQPAYHRPPRRFQHLVGIVPGTATNGRPKIMAVIDTSSSMNKAMLERISGELQRLRRAGEVIVVECDTKIQATYRLQRTIKNVKGRGGTDLRPPFGGECLRKVRPDAVVYFTDGDGKAPTAAPRLPVLWCLTPGGKQPADWGRIVHL